MGRAGGRTRPAFRGVPPLGGLHEYLAFTWGPLSYTCEYLRVLGEYLVNTW